MGDLVFLRDYHLQKLERDAATLAGELVKFAKQGQPVVEGADPWAGCHCPEGIDGLPAMFPDWTEGGAA